MEPDNSILHNILGVHLAKLEKLEEAVLHYQTALELDSNFFPALYNLGRAKYRQGKVRTSNNFARLSILRAI